MAREPKYGDVYRMPEDGSLWMILCRDGEPSGRPPHQNYWQIPLTYSRDVEMKALEDTATGWQLGDYVDD